MYLKSEQKLELLTSKCTKLETCVMEQDHVIYELTEKVDELTKTIKRYDNSNTPSSKKPLGVGNSNKTGEEDGQDKQVAKRGPVEGHEGTTNKQKPDAEEEKALEECPKCKCRVLIFVKTISRTLTDIPPPQKPVTIRHKIHVYRCSCCNEVVSNTAGIPKKGEIGMNAIIQIVKGYENRLPYRKIKQNMKDMGISISTGGIFNKLRYIGESLGGPSSDILKSIRKSKILHADETSLSLNGKVAWMWVFHDPRTQNTFYIIRESRGRDVLDEVLPGWRGTLVCDGWRPYQQYTIQRCFAHLLNEAKHIAEHEGTAEAWRMYAGLLRIYRRACGIRGSREHREREQRNLHSAISYMIRKYEDDPILEAFMTKLANAKKDMFRFVVDPAIPSTNNAAERQIRELVVHRKIRGCIRSNDTMEWLGNLLTCMATWKNHSLGMEKVAEYV